MDIAYRIQTLRKAKGVSQEELADQIGVSRQAVSKWESEQSMPELDKIILLSEYFSVTTDYLLKGIESGQPRKAGVDANVFVIVATVLNFIGLAVACTVWYEKQIATAYMIGFIFMALGCMVYAVGLLGSAQETRTRARRNFWRANIWLLCFMPLSLLISLLVYGYPSPYPLFMHPLAGNLLFLALYAVLCVSVVLLANRKDKK